MAAVKTDSGFVDNWQSRKTLTECNLHMLTTEDSCDVSFRVGKDEKVIRAHRYVLISRSSVFHAMLTGPLAEKGCIKIPDVEADVFCELLKFLYTDKSSPDATNVTGLLYLARKYDVEILENRCLTYLETLLSPEEACVILEEAHVFDEEQLFDRALRLILENGKICLLTKGFQALCQICVHRVINADELDAKPEQMFSAVTTWAEEECRRQRREITSDNMRFAVGEMLYSIPFHEMDQKHFQNVVVPKMILTEKETLTIQSCFVCPKKDPCPFKRRLAKTKHASYPHPSIDKCCDVIFYDGQKANTDIRSSTIHDEFLFKCDRNVLICGVHLFRATATTVNESSAISETYRLRIHRLGRIGYLEDEVYQVVMATSLGEDNIVTMYLKEPVPITGGSEHYVFVESTVNGIHKYVGEGLRNSVTVGQCMFNSILKPFMNRTHTIYGFIVRQ